MNILFSLLALFLIQPSHAAEMKFVSFKGNVSTEYKGTKTPAKPGAEIQFGDKIIGDAESFAVILLPHETVALKGPFEVIVQANPSVKDLAELQLNSGKLRAKFVGVTLKKKDKFFAVRSPVAVMGVRGTDLWASYEPVLGESEAICFEHEITLANAKGSGTTSIKTGQWGGIGGRFGDKIRKPIQLSESFLKSVLDQYPLEHVNTDTHH